MKCRILAVGLTLMFALGTTGCAQKSKSRAAATPPPPPTRTEAPPVATQEPTPAPKSEAVQLTPVFFGYDSSRLTSEGRAALDRMARELRENATMELTLEGHCDERGTSEYNMALGERRAQAARAYLVASGVSANRMRIVSYGKERPFDEGHGETAWAANRRAHPVIR